MISVSMVIEFWVLEATVIGLPHLKMELIVMEFQEELHYSLPNSIIQIHRQSFFAPF